MALSSEQYEVIKGMLDEGADPERIVGYLARIGDMDEIEEVELRSAVYDIQRGEYIPPSTT